MTSNAIVLVVNLVSLATGLVAGLVTCGVALKLRAQLFSGRWFLLWLLATLITLVGSIVVLEMAVNWNNPSSLFHVWVDPGPLQKGFPLFAVTLGAFWGGWLASRNARRAPAPTP
jgi:hypothetical protein